MEPSPAGAGPEIGNGHERGQPTPIEGFCLLLASWGLFVVASLLHRGPGPASGLHQAMVLVFAALLPALAWVALRGRWSILSLGRIDLKKVPWVAGLCLAASLSSLGIAGLLSGFTAAGAEEEALSKLLLPYPALARFLLFAITPAVCEEALFRGAVLNCFASWPKRANCLFNALAFGAFHSSLIRLAPSSVLGYGFSLAALRGGSLWFAVAAHAIHNSAVLAIAASGFDVRTLPGWFFGLCAAGGLAVLVVGEGGEREG